MKPNLQWALSLWLVAAWASPCTAAVVDMGQFKLMRLRDHAERTFKRLDQDQNGELRADELQQADQEVQKQLKLMKAINIVGGFQSVPPVPPTTLTWDAAETMNLKQFTDVFLVESARFDASIQAIKGALGHHKSSIVKTSPPEPAAAIQIPQFPAMNVQAVPKPAFPQAWPTVSASKPVVEKAKPSGKDKDDRKDDRSSRDRERERERKSERDRDRHSVSISRSGGGEKKESRGWERERQQRDRIKERQAHEWERVKNLRERNQKR